MGKFVAIITDLEQLQDILDSMKKAGVDLVSIHNVNLNQELFMILNQQF